MRRKLFFLNFLFLCLFSLSAYAQTQGPSLTVQDQRSQKPVPLRIQSLNIDVKILGEIAVTTFTFDFVNETSRMLEGEFTFPLEEGVSVSRFALEVDGKLREGVVVEKAKGRKVFEEITRNRVDPGLLEKVSGNSFRARVFPVNPKSTKKLLIATERILTRREQGLIYRLPFSFNYAIQRFSMQVASSFEKPKFSQKSSLEGDFQKRGQDYLLEFRRDNYQLPKNLTLFIPSESKIPETLTENDSELGKTYFYTRIKVPDLSDSKPKPKRIAVFWDTSGSSSERNLNKELALLELYLKKNPQAQVALTFFSHAPEKPQIFEVQGKGWESLKKSLISAIHDGGTSLGNLDFSKVQADEILLFSDGLSNFGKEEPVLSSVPIYSISSEVSANPAFLEFLVRKTGGMYLNLTSMTPEEGVRLLEKTPLQLLKTEIISGQAMQIYPGGTANVSGMFSSCGILVSDQASLLYSFGRNGKVLFEQKVLISKQADSQIRYPIKRIWAQQKLAELEVYSKTHEKQILALGKEFGIVTRGTSLIVLDRLADYVRYQIVPPEELKKDYYAQVEAIQRSKKEDEQRHLDEVAVKFKEFENWWNREFDLGNPPKKESAKKMEDQESFSASDESLREERPARSMMMRERSAPASRNGAMKKSVQSENGSVEGGIQLAKWEPDTPYLKELKKVSPEKAYETYLNLKGKYAKSSAFYLDAADYFFHLNQKENGLRILSNIAEMELENPALLRILAHRLAQLGYFELSAGIFEQVLALREEEPQSYRDLALVYQSLSRNQRAADLLYEVVRRKWDGRFPDIELIALNELNALISFPGEIDTSKMDSRLIRSMPVDIRVILTWDADNTDMDLWVTDPNGEKCFYSNSLTYLGGKISRDFTGGYGPEEFMLKRAKAGEYLIEVNYYGNTQQLLAGDTTIQLQLFLNYGRKDQMKKEITLRLKDKSEVIKVGTFQIRANQKLSF